jgi:hypothetical protein
VVTLECSAAATDGVTLVELLVVADTPTRVTVENCLDGPVWPPRSQGLPAAGWTDDGFEGVVTDRLALGYASPAEPRDPPARVADTAPADADGSDTPTPRELVRRLGRAEPPRDAVGDDRRNECLRDLEPAVADTALPPAVDAWLDDVAARIDAAEGLADATAGSEASATAASAGGPETAATPDRVAADRAALGRLLERVGALARRADRTTVPAEVPGRSG